MELQGKIIAALDVKTGTSARGEWKVQEFVLETIDGQFSRKMVFSVFGEEYLRKKGTRSERLMSFLSRCTSRIRCTQGA